MKRKIKLNDLLILFMALNCVGIGVALLVNFNYGVDPISMFQLGISKQFNVTMGTASLIYNVMILVLAVVLNPTKLGIGTLVYAVSVGHLIDIHLTWVSSLSQSYALAFYVAGHLVLCLGYALMLYLDKGMTAIDSCLLYFKERYGLSYKNTRYGVDGVLCIMAIIMGVELKVGLIFIYATTGILVERYVLMLRKK